MFAVRDHLRETVPLAPDECDLRPEGKPPSNMGRRYVAVWEGGVENAAEGYLEEAFLISVVLTVEVRPAPDDRLGEALRRNCGPLAELESAVKRRLHCD